MIKGFLSYLAQLNKLIRDTYGKVHEHTKILSVLTEEPSVLDFILKSFFNSGKHMICYSNLDLYI